MKKQKDVKKKILSQAVTEMGAVLGYATFLSEIKARVAAAQTRATMAVNREMLALYWHIGRSIIERQKTEKWGSSVIERFATDMQKAFPGIEGFSERNIWKMRAFYLAYPEKLSRTAATKINHSFLPQAVAEIPWGHQVVLIETVKSSKERDFYAKMALKNGWSRAILMMQIESGLAARQGKAITNFKNTILPPHSDMAQQSLKDPYVFDFLTLATDAQEHEFEQGLMNHVQKFLLELGVGFAFVGRQVHLKVGKKDYYVDLLFYHLTLRRFFVIELKTKAFEPEFAGKMNFYLSAVDDKFKHPDDQPSIGLLLCKSKDKFEVEYALRRVSSPISVSAWETRLVESLPKELKASLPTVKQLEEEFSGEKEK
ncbi:PDDEXK nuclease domain-containing protein [Bdellovibrionota bacterium FG-2]